MGIFSVVPINRVFRSPVAFPTVLLSSGQIYSPGSHTGHLQRIKRRSYTSLGTVVNIYHYIVYYLHLKDFKASAVTKNLTTGLLQISFCPLTVLYYKSQLKYTALDLFVVPTPIYLKIMINIVRLYIIRV